MIWKPRAGTKGKDFCASPHPPTHCHHGYIGRPYEFVIIQEIISDVKILKNENKDHSLYPDFLKDWSSVFLRIRLSLHHPQKLRITVYVQKSDPYRIKMSVLIN